MNSRFFSMMGLLAAIFAQTGCANLLKSLALDDFEALDDPQTITQRNHSSPRGRSRRSTPSDQTEDSERWMSARRAQQIALGMPMSDVRSTLGEPQRIEIAGQAGLGYEKWVYYEGLTSSWSLGSARNIYFEEGRVAGWDTSSK